MHNEKFCVQCKHKTVCGDICRHPSLWTEKLNLVTGEIDLIPKDVHPILCSKQRTSYGICGLEGKLFEPAPNYTEQDRAMNRTILSLLGLLVFGGMIYQLIQFYWK